MFSISHWNFNGKITCDRSSRDFDLCKADGPTLFDPNASTFSMMGQQRWAQQQYSLKSRPYPRKQEKTTMSLVREVVLTSAPPKISCGVIHNSPALVFSAGGFTGNFFHAFDDGFIPLFITINSLFSDQDVVLVVTDGDKWWFQKYAELLARFSRHPIIDANISTTAHCFPSVVVGLIKHGPVIINPELIPYPKTLLDFHHFLKNTYMKNHTMLSPISNNKPRLILMTRVGNVSRVIMNEEEVAKVAQKIGFNVHVFDPSAETSMAKAYKLVHNSHAMLGLHGAGLTHFWFLRAGAVLVQVVPIGTEWPSKTYFEKPARAIGLEYIEYKIGANESSLLDRYEANSLVVKDPNAYSKGEWDKMQTYLQAQNVKLDITRFRKCLKKAYKKAKRFMGRERAG